MTDSLPMTQIYNLNRLGNAGDEVHFAADPAQRAAIAQWSAVPALGAWAAEVTLTKLGPTRFGLDFTITADVTQACVVTLESVPSHLEHKFHRELHFTGLVRHKLGADSGAELVLDVGDEEGPEEIESLHYDLAAPALEEYVLALDPYPRKAGVAFDAPKAGLDAPESPFAVLKGLKSQL